MISRNNAVLILTDFQGNLARAMVDKENLFANNVKLIRGFKVLALPMMVTEQVPAKLGPTIPQLVSELDGLRPIAKETFSSWATAAFHDRLEFFARRHVVLTGIESHVCVYQTALDLMANGYTVHLVTDAVSSRTPENRALGIESIKNAGGHLTSTEMVLFELLRTAADPMAKDIFKIVK
jgi:nicotinamidase-related amidase